MDECGGGGSWDVANTSESLNLAGLRRIRLMNRKAVLGGDDERRNFFWLKKLKSKTSSNQGLNDFRFCEL